MIKKTYKVQGMHCTSCALMIEADLEDAGVKARCNYAKETLEVETDESNADVASITAVVGKAGYTIRPV